MSWPTRGRCGRPGNGTTERVGALGLPGRPSDTVRRFLTGLVDTISFTAVNPAQARTEANQQLQALTGKPLPAPVLSAAFGNLAFTADPIASSLAKQAADAVAAGTVTGPGTDGIFDLKLLNQVPAFAWRSPMACELIVTLAHRPSLGHRLDNARTSFDYPGMLVRHGGHAGGRSRPRCRRVRETGAHGAAPPRPGRDRRLTRRSGR